MQKVAVVVGTRPEGIKLAPLVRALAADGTFAPVLVSTGQHRGMLDQALAAFDLAPDVDLAVMRPGQTLTDVAARTLAGMQEVLRAEAPAWVVVQGDTTTALAAALAAYHARVPVAHVEAGLRSGRRDVPFPEEMNRQLVDRLSDALFAPTAAAGEALLAEGFPAGAVEVTGNTVVDALLAARERLRRAPVAVPGVDLAELEGRQVILVTAHRRESFGGALEAICLALRELARALPAARIVYPVHLNPAVEGPVRRLLAGCPGVALLPPVGYLEFVTLLERCDLVLTDSGGVQEEAPAFGKPLLVLRDVTERPDGVAAGVARLVGTRAGAIVDAATTLLRDPVAYRAMSRGVNPYGDGRAAARIAASLVQRAGARRAA